MAMMIMEYRVLQNLCNRLGAQGVLLYKLRNVYIYPCLLFCVVVCYYIVPLNIDFFIWKSVHLSVAFCKIL